MEIEIIGTIGMLLTTLSGIPQVAKTLKTHSVQDLSLGFYLILSIGLILGLIYVSYLRIYVYIIGDIISLTICGIIIGCKILWSNKKEIKNESV